MAVIRNHDVDVSAFSYDPVTGVVTRHLANGESRPFGFPGKYGYLIGRIDGHEIQIARLAWRLHHGVWPEKTVDHRDKVKTHNWIDNLREATDGQNRLNQNASSRNTSGYKGVSYDAECPGRPWRAIIIRDRRRHFLGYYATAEEAGAAYDKAALTIHGEFASLNGEVTAERLAVRRTRKKSRTGLYGVTVLARDNGRSVYKATIMHEGKQRFHGLHPTAEDAALTYDDAVRGLKAKRPINYPLTGFARLGFYPPIPGVIFDLGLSGMIDLDRRRREAGAR